MSELEDLRRDVIELREWKAAIIGKCKASNSFDTLEWGGDKEGWGFIHYFIGHLETRALQAEAQVETARAKAIEECAKIAETGEKDCAEGDTNWHQGFRYAAKNTAIQIASRIRSLTSTMREGE